MKPVSFRIPKKVRMKEIISLAVCEWVGYVRHPVSASYTFFAWLYKSKVTDR